MPKKEYPILPIPSPTLYPGEIPRLNEGRVFAVSENTSETHNLLLCAICTGQLWTTSRPDSEDTVRRKQLLKAIKP